MTTRSPARNHRALALGAILLLTWAAAFQADAATIDVNTTQDIVGIDGKCSLREAIKAANTHASSGGQVGECAAGDGFDDTIVVPAGTYALNISGADEDNAASGDLDIRVDVSIGGAGLGETIIDASGLSDRAFDLPVAGVSATLHDLTIQNGHAPDGTTGPGKNGGGINNAMGSTLYLTRVELAGNRAGDGAIHFPGSYGGGSGGALWNNGGNVVLQGCWLHDNHAGNGGDTDGMSTVGNGGNGGAFWSSNGAVSISTTRFQQNIAGDAGSGPGTPVAGFGGGVYAYGGSLSVIQSWFDANQTGASNGSGGGMYVNGLAALSITQSGITRNVSSYTGGGIYGVTTAFTLVNVTVSGNSAALGGGLEMACTGMSKMDFATVSANHASTEGGGFFCTGLSSAGSVTVRNSIVSGNSAPTKPDCDDPDSALSSLGYNIAGDACPANAAGDVATTSPRLGPLGSNGGIGASMVPAPGGPAVDRGSCSASALAVDQRTHDRFVDVPQAPNAIDACDIGAIELDDDIFWGDLESHGS